MRHFRDGETVVVEPWRTAAFPVAQGLLVDRGASDRTAFDRGAFDRVAAGG